MTKRGEYMFTGLQARNRLVGEWFSNKLDKLEVVQLAGHYVLESSFGEEYEIL